MENESFTLAGVAVHAYYFFALRYLLRVPLALLIVIPCKVHHMLTVLIGHTKALQVFVGSVAYKHANFHDFSA